MILDGGKNQPNVKVHLCIIGHVLQSILVSNTPRATAHTHIERPQRRVVVLAVEGLARMLPLLQFKLRKAFCISLTNYP